MPKVSIIVPVFNADRFLNQCVNSILKQTFVDWELLLVDDGSTDSSLSICQKYAKSDNRIVIYHKENGGVSSARNIGIKYSEGEWVAFVDSDDWLEQDYLSNLIQYDNSDMVLGGYKDEKSTHHKPSSYNMIIDLKDIDFSINKSNQFFYFPWRRLYRKRIIVDNNISFDERIKLSEDTCFTIHYLAYCNKIAFSTECNYIYRAGTGPTKYKLNYNEFKIHCKIMKESVFSYFIKTGVKLDKIEQNILSNYFFYYKDYLNSVNTFKTYVQNVKGWTKSELLSFINIYLKNQNILKRFFYYIMISYPRIGYLVSKTKGI